MKQSAFLKLAFDHLSSFILPQKTETSKYRATTRGTKYLKADFTLYTWKINISFFISFVQALKAKN